MSGGFFYNAVSTDSLDIRSRSKRHVGHGRYVEQPVQGLAVRVSGSGLWRRRWSGRTHLGLEVRPWRCSRRSLGQTARRDCVIQPCPAQYEESLHFAVHRETDLNARGFKCLGGLAWIPHSANTVEAISNFAPQLILSNLGSTRQIQLTTCLAEKLGVWIVPFFHNDWPSTMYADNAMTAYPKLVLKSKLNRCLRLAPTGLGNSDEMAREYSVRYGRRFHAFTNCVEIGEYESQMLSEMK